MGVMGVMGNQRGKKENYMQTGLIQFFFFIGLNAKIMVLSNIFWASASRPQHNVGRYPDVYIIRRGALTWLRECSFA